MATVKKAAKKVAPKKVVTKKTTTSTNEASTETSSNSNPDQSSIASRILSMDEFIEGLLGKRNPVKDVDLFNCRIVLSKLDSRQMVDLLHESIRSKGVSFKDQMRLIEDLRIALTRSSEDDLREAERDLDDLRRGGY